MRKVKITKQDVVNPKAVFMGFTKKQIIILIVGFAVSIGTFALLFLCCKFNIDAIMTVVFIELLITAGLSIIKINGMSLIKWLYIAMQGPKFRPYQSKGALDKYEKEQKTKQ